MSDEITELVCRGSMALGNGCGKCSRCRSERVPYQMVEDAYLAGRKHQNQETISLAVVGHHIMLRCPHCDQQYDAEIGNNPLAKNGLTITPVPIEVAVESETEQ